MNAGASISHHTEDEAIALRLARRGSQTSDARRIRDTSAIRYMGVKTIRQFSLTANCWRCTTLCDLVQEARELVKRHGSTAGLPTDDDGIASAVAVPRHTQMRSRLYWLSLSTRLLIRVHASTMDSKEDRREAGIRPTSSSRWCGTTRKSNPFSEIGGSFSASAKSRLRSIGETAMPKAAWLRLTRRCHVSTNGTAGRSHSPPIHRITTTFPTPIYLISFTSGYAVRLKPIYPRPIRHACRTKG